MGAIGFPNAKVPSRCFSTRSNTSLSEIRTTARAILSIRGKCSKELELDVVAVDVDEKNFGGREKTSCSSR
jgi:hypothetical protein